MKQIKDVVILILDGIPDKNGDFFDKTTTITCDHYEVPVTDASGYAIGYAIPAMNINGDHKLRVELNFYEEITAAQATHQPCFMGKCIARMVDHILEAKLTSVMISKYNADDRVPKIGTYIGMPTETAAPNKNECSCERLLNGHEDGCGWRHNGQDKH